MNALTKRKSNFPSTFRDDLFSPVETAFDEFFNNFFKGTTLVDRVRATAGFPKLDVVEMDDEFILRAAVPGMKAEDVRVEMLDDCTVEVSGRMSEEYRCDDDKRCIRELSQKSFTRRVFLPEGTGDPLSAKVKDGMLTVTWAKKPEVPEPEQKRLIPVVSE